MDDFEPASIREAAADWFVRRRDGLPPGAEAAYRAWIDADPRHAAAMAELGRTWEAVSYPVAAGRRREAAAALDRRAAARRRRPYVIATAGLAAAAALAFSFLPQFSPLRAGRTAASVAAHPNIARLPDGSTVELNKGAEIAANYTPGRRGIRLVRGEAFFSVAKDPARPFVVSAGGVEVRAVGTAFAVRSGAEGVGVVVTEGRVAVHHAAPGAPHEPGAAPPPPANPPIYLDAGRSLAVEGGRLVAAQHLVKPISAGEIEAVLAWRNSRLEFSRMPLADVAAMFNKRNRVQLSIADATAAAIPISGTFWSDDPEGFVRLLESGLGVRSRRAADTIFVGSR